MQSNDMDDWTERDSVVAQAMANYLGIEVSGFPPQRSASPEELRQLIPVPDFDIEILRNNIPVLQSVVLSAFLRGSDTKQHYVATEIEPEHFWNKSFRKFLFEIMLDQFRQTGRISMAETQASIPEYSTRVYGEAPTRRTLVGKYYTWTQILMFRPSWRQVERSLQRIKQIPKPDGA